KDQENKRIANHGKMDTSLKSMLSNPYIWLLSLIFFSFNIGYYGHFVGLRQVDPHGTLSLRLTWFIIKKMYYLLAKKGQRPLFDSFRR
ncbi:MAG: hypothetical protein ACK5M5_03575, partial [Limnobaculum xujianqingii]